MVFCFESGSFLSRGASCRTGQSDPRSHSPLAEKLHSFGRLRSYLGFILAKDCNLDYASSVVETHPAIAAPAST